MDRNQVDIALKGGAAIMVAAAAAAEAQDLQGIYGGLSYTRGEGEIIDGSAVYAFDGNAVGGFVGYNHVVGDWVFGGELAFSNGEYLLEEATDSPDISARNMLDIKVRFGRVFGKTLAYGVVGRSDFEFTIDAGGEEVSDGSATAIGLGFEAPIGSKGFVGGEYLMRKDLKLNGNDAQSYASGGSELNTLSLRMGLRF